MKNYRGYHLHHVHLLPSLWGGVGLLLLIRALQVDGTFLLLIMVQNKRRRGKKQVSMRREKIEQTHVVVAAADTDSTVDVDRTQLVSELLLVHVAIGCLGCFC